METETLTQPDTADLHAEPEPTEAELCDACGIRPAGCGHFALYCTPCAELPLGQAAPATPAPFAPGDRVRRTKLDNAAGTVETVNPHESETGRWIVAVRLDKDDEVWSGTEAAWEAEAMSAEEVAARVSVRRERDREGWHYQINAQGTLTDAEAAGITFRSEPGVTLGEHVNVDDAAGTRIGYVKSATYHERALGPAYVVCTIELR